MSKKGYKQTEEHKKKRSLALKGKFFGGGFQKGHPGFVTSEGYKRGGDAQRGKKKKPMTTEVYKIWLEKQRLAKRGKKFSEEAKRKMSESHKGNKSYLWKGGISKFNRTERENIMSSLEYKNWRKAVFERDDYRCLVCGAKSGEMGKNIVLNADHIYQFAQYTRLRFEIHNGQTLCESCHKAKTIFERVGKVNFNNYANIN